MKFFDEMELDSPSDDLISTIRARYPTEREMDAVLTRKMHRRHLPPYSGVDLSRMTGHLKALLDQHIPGAYEVSEQRWFSGGASKIQMGFDLRWERPLEGVVTTKMVVRMEPSESVNTTSRKREYELLNALSEVVPVPRVYWVDAEAEYFPEPALIYEFVAGVTKPSQTATGKVAGIGTNFGPELRATLANQFVGYLAAIHNFDVSSAKFDAFNVPLVNSTQSALWQLNRARRIWEEDRGEDLPLIEVAANWLERNMPVLDKVCVVHGDYRSGNFLFDEATAKITAILDWERGYLGDRHRDLAWTADQAFGHLAEDGTTFLASGLVPVRKFFDDYETLTGMSVDADSLRYYTIFNSFQLVMSAIASAYRVVKLGKSHQDILLASVEPIGYAAANKLRMCLREVI